MNPLELGAHDPTERPALRLVKDIAAQHRHLAIDDATKRVVDHIRAFWDPRLRAELMEVPAPTGDGLIDAVLAALAHR